MTTLKEIEARLGHLHDTSICTAEDCFRREHGDLLIRGVRQLGEAYGNLTKDMEHPWIDRFYHVDPDVLALREDADAQI